MPKNGPKANNHLYPLFHIKKWKEKDGKFYNKITHKSTGIGKGLRFTSKYYYSLGKKNSILEDKICAFECYIASIITNIVKSDCEINLSGKELELLKLYCVLCAQRHHYTCEVIKSDKSGEYRSNNYLFGVKRIKSQKEAVLATTQLLDEFKRIKSLRNNVFIPISYIENNIYSFDTMGLHLVILKTKDPILCISEKFCIIENTIDSEFLYSYIPIAPNTALLLVKSKYYLDKQHYNDTLQRLYQKYGLREPETYISTIFDDVKNNYENLLFCHYNYSKSTISKANPALSKQINSNNINIKILTLPEEIALKFNSIYCEDGNYILYCSQKELEKALKTHLPDRDITI